MFGNHVVFMAALFFMAGSAGRATAQQCPRAPASPGPSIASRAEAIQGKLIHHDGIRNWFELKLDRPMCGQKSIQLTVSNDNWKSLESVRGCRVNSFGKIDFASTGYYSLDLRQDVTRLKPVGACIKAPPFPDYSKAQPLQQIRNYRVDMHVDYRPGDHPILFNVRSGRRELHPWQAYAGYMLTGGFVLYGRCGRGFVVDQVYGTPEARPTHSDDARDPSDMATFDPETAAQSGKTDLRLGYTCTRAR